VLICDTSGLLARYDPMTLPIQSSKAVATFDQATMPFVASPLVLADVAGPLLDR
jgi:hypothetical protein